MRTNAMSTVLNVKLPGKYPTPLPTPPPLFSLCHCDVTRALTCEIEQSSQPKHTHLDNELCGERVALTAHIHTHTDVSTCEVLLSFFLTLCLSVTLSLSRSFSF